MRIGLMMTDGIGDLVCALGVVQAVRQRWPDAFICGVIRGREEATLFSGASRLDHVIPYRPAEGNTPARVLGLVRSLRRLRLDVFLVTTDIDHVKAPLLAVASGASMRVGEVGSPFGRWLYSRWTVADRGMHKVHSNAAILSNLIGGDVPEPRIEVTRAERAAARDLLHEHGAAASDMLLGVHAGSSSALEHKRWPAEHYIAALDQLGEAGIRPVLLGAGPAEVEAATKIRDALQRPDRALLLAGHTSLRVTAAVIGCCHAALGADSGVMHIAAAVGTPAIVLFGPTDERRTAPFSAMRVVTADVPCRPCFDRLPYGCGEPMCMSTLPVDSVVRAVLDATAGGRQELYQLERRT